ncbi:hypothetical protein PISS_b0192 [Pseudoalteromonas issachenkonii]|uniref:Uncharacterized protein n=1 Tax=Pseudoalteromonas issachenkonii TaxID=152297 RepID=A0ABM6N7I9_9GAMM|nr:hypothetical protein PSM_B0146 [Pseudoalteromonas sp. SM9913]ATC92367.1 hypothetical protein PISS_b0192 [Pseudoalteromonas issachenkonii]
MALLTPKKMLYTTLVWPRPDSLIIPLTFEHLGYCLFDIASIKFL